MKTSTHTNENDETSLSTIFFYYRHHSTNSNQQSIPHLLDFKDLGSQHEQNHITSLLDNSFAKVAKVLRVESFRYIYLVKNTALRRLDTEVIKKAKNLDEADYLISQGLKDGAPLMLLTGETSGELVNYQIVKNQHQINYKSIHRILENFHLWTNRYIQPKVIQNSDFYYDMVLKLIFFIDFILC